MAISLADVMIKVLTAALIVSGTIWFAGIGLGDATEEQEPPGRTAEPRLYWPPPEGLEVTKVGAFIEAREPRLVGLERAIASELTGRLGAPVSAVAARPSLETPPLVRTLLTADPPPPAEESSQASNANCSIHVANARIAMDCVERSLTVPLDEFFLSRLPSTVRLDALVKYDEMAGRFFVIALLHRQQTDLAALWLAVSDEDTGIGGWTQASLPAWAEVDGATHRGEIRTVLLDETGVVVVARLHDAAGSEGVRIWTLARGLGEDGFYDGGRLRAAVFGY